MISLPRITFGVIVLNGEPFTRYCLRQLYPFAHEIIVVEGACENARAIATGDGHSRDGTLEAIRQFQAEEDPEKKVTLVTREGFWPEKDEMSQAYADRATGDWLWQVDIDEFHTQGDMELVCRILTEHPEITMVSFPQITFWGAFDVACDSVYLRTYKASQCHRVFRWGPGYRYATHRPPTVLSPEGIDLRKMHWLDAHQTESLGILMYHYSLLFPHQVTEKCEYYSRFGWEAARESDRWARECYMKLSHPFRVHNTYRYPSWLMPYRGRHPEQIERMKEDIAAGRLQVPMRPMEDARRLIEAPWYRVGRGVLRLHADWTLPLLLKAKALTRGFGLRRRLKHWISG